MIKARTQIASLCGSLGLALGLLVIAMVMLACLAGLAGTQPAYAAGEDGTRDVITPTALAATGVTMSLGAASGDGQQFENTGQEIVIITNGYTDTITMTVVTGGQVGGLDIEDVDIAVAPGATRLAGPFTKAIFDQPTATGVRSVYLDFDAAVTGTVAGSVTLHVYQVP